VDHVMVLSELAARELMILKIALLATPTVAVSRDATESVRGGHW